MVRVCPAMDYLFFAKVAIEPAWRLRCLIFMLFVLFTHIIMCVVVSYGAMYGIVVHNIIIYNITSKQLCYIVILGIMLYIYLCSFA